MCGVFVMVEYTTLYTLVYTSKLSCLMMVVENIWVCSLTKIIDIQAEVYFPIREINLSQAKKMRQMAHTLEFFISNFQYCLFTFGTISQRGMHESKSQAT